MAEVYKLTEPYILAQAGIIRRASSTSSELRIALYRLGGELGKRIVENFYLRKRSITTPMNCDTTSIVPEIPLSAVITTKDDMPFFGKGLTEVLGDYTLGYMNFEGRRGIQALNSSIRTIEFQNQRHKAVELLVIGKSVLATGCTAISLTRTALAHFNPEKLIITTIFFSNNGLADLMQEFPHASIFVVGEPDTLTEDGLLTPGVGLLDERMGA